MLDLVRELLRKTWLRKKPQSKIFDFRYLTEKNFSWQVIYQNKFLFSQDAAIGQRHKLRFILACFLSLFLQYMVDSFATYPYSCRIYPLVLSIAKFVVSLGAFCKLRRIFGFFCSVNHLSGPLRKHMFACSSSKGHGLWFVIGGFRSVLLFRVSRFVALWSFCFRQ